MQGFAQMSTQLYEIDGLHDLMYATLEDIHGLGSVECPNFWVPRAIAENAGRVRHPAERIVAELYQILMKDKLSQTFDGAEWWLQKYEGGKGLGFHFDKDEHAMAERGEMWHPELSSILYLTGGSKSPRQAPTVVLNQRYDVCHKCPDPEDPSECVFVFPKAGNFLVFDGSLGHGVLEGLSEDIRITLLINWWTYQPESVRRVTSVDMSKYKLRPWTEEERSAHGPTVQQVTAKRAEHIPLVTILESMDRIQQLDDVVGGAGIAISGACAVDIVAVQYKGLALYPAADQFREAGDVVDCAAAFVPLAALADLDSPSEGDDEAPS